MDRQGSEVLNESNFCIWKIQCKMAKDDLWGIVCSSEVQPTIEVERRKLKITKDRVLAIIVLVISPKLLYFIGDPNDPKVVWDKPCNQFQRKHGLISWAGVVNYAI